MLVKFSFPSRQNFLYSAAGVSLVLVHFQAYVSLAYLVLKLKHFNTDHSLIIFFFQKDSHLEENGRRVCSRLDEVQGNIYCKDKNFNLKLLKNLIVKNDGCPNVKYL